MGCCLGAIIVFIILLCLLNGSSVPTVEIVEIVVGLALLAVALSIISFLLTGSVQLIISIFSLFKKNSSVNKLEVPHGEATTKHDVATTVEDGNLTGSESHRSDQEQQELNNYRTRYTQEEAGEPPFVSMFDHEATQEDETAEGLGIGEITIEDVDNER